MLRYVRTSLHLGIGAVALLGSRALAQTPASAPLTAQKTPVQPADKPAPSQAAREIKIMRADAHPPPPANEFVAVQSERGITEFAKHGGHFDTERDQWGGTAGLTVTGNADEAALTAAYILAGGRLTTQWDEFGRPPVPGQRRYKTTEATSPAHATAARWVYDGAVKAQGGPLTPLPKDQFAAVLDGPEGMAAFRKAGGRFTFEPNRNTASLAMMETVGHNKYIRPQYKTYISETHISDTEGRPAQHMAAALGADIIAAFAQNGGTFSDDLDSEDATPGMLVVSRGPAAIAAFCKAGGRFTDKQNSRGVTAGMVAVMAGPDAIAAFARCGGHFTDQQDERGMTAALLAVTRLDEQTPDHHDIRRELRFPSDSGIAIGMNLDDTAVAPFLAAGGRFNDQRNKQGESAGVLALMNSPATVRAWHKAGGHFVGSDQDTSNPPEHYASRSPDLVRAYCEAGGTFTTHARKLPDNGMYFFEGGQKRFHVLTPQAVWADYYATELDVVTNPDAEVITAYSECGGLFTDRDYGAGWTSERIASHVDEYELSHYFRGVEPMRDVNSPESQSWLADRKKQHPTRDEEGAKAYAAAIVRQGGIRHVE